MTQVSSSNARDTAVEGCTLLMRRVGRSEVRTLSVVVMVLREDVDARGRGGRRVVVAHRRRGC